MSENKSTYRQIMKATSIFGGVQVIQIIVQIIRSKAVAILLGPAGMGINNLLNFTIQLIGALTNFGLQISAVKKVVEANTSGKHDRVCEIVIILRRCVWLTGLLGVILTIVFSSWLSKLTFGSDEYSLAFVLISVTLLFNQLRTGQLVVLQGLRKLKYLANASALGAVLGLIISLPLYYFFKVDGIVPVIILASAINLLLSWIFTNKVKLKKIKVSLHKTVVESKEMLTMGFVLSLCNLMALGIAYLLRIYVNNKGGIADVGYYSAGFGFIEAYVGMVFTAISTDYYPRLSSVAADNIKARETINQQAEITILIVAPIIIFSLVFIHYIVILLYSSKFTVVSNMIQWALLGTFFKAVSWCVGFIFLAKGAIKLCFLVEIIAVSYMLLINIGGYNFYALNGLGIAFLLGYLIYSLQVYFIAKTKYEFKFEKPFIKIFITQLLLGCLCFINVKVLEGPYSYIIGCFLLFISSIYSFRQLNQKLDLKQLYNKFINGKG